MKKGKERGWVHISFSEFSLFNQCGHKHLIQKHLGIDQEPMSIHLLFGDAIHAAVEMGIDGQCGIERRVELFLERFKKRMFEEMRDSPDYKQLDAFAVQGVHILRILDLKKIFENYELVSVEEPLYEKIFGKFYFKGFVDLVLKHRITRRILIIDWKTSTMAWDLKYKLKDNIFLMQMMLYKYFWGRKNNVDLSVIDTKYIVLNRLKDKKDPDKGFGEIQEVIVSSSVEEIRTALETVAKTIRQIHIDQTFPKAKFLTGKDGNILTTESGEYLTDDKPCFFCKYKWGRHPLCNKSLGQDQTLLKENHKIV